MRKLFLGLAIITGQLIFAQKVVDVKVDGNQKKDLPVELGKDKIAVYNVQFANFIAALKSSDRKGMESLLAPKAKEVVTDAVYKKLAADIDFKKTLVFFKSGYKSTMDGKMYPMIIYKYSDDQSATPENIVTAVFENDGKILGIKPKSKKEAGTK